MREHARRWLLCAVLALVALVALPQAALAEAKPVWRLYNRYDGDHMWTLDKAEYDSLVKAGWTGEGKAWQAPHRESMNEGFVYRLYNPWSGEHLFTMDEGEYNQLGKAGWRKEGTAFESARVGAPAWRLYHRWLTRGTHLYTTDKVEYDRLVKLGWVGEGVRFCGKLPESRLKQLTRYYRGYNSLVGGDDWGPSLSTGISMSIRDDVLTLTPKGDRALLVKFPFDGSAGDETIINSAGELSGGKLSFRLTESTAYVVEYDAPTDAMTIFYMTSREGLEKTRLAWRGEAETLGRHDEVVVDARGNVVSLLLR